MPHGLPEPSPCPQCGSKRTWITSTEYQLRLEGARKFSRLRALFEDLEDGKLTQAQYELEAGRIIGDMLPTRDSSPTELRVNLGRIGTWDDWNTLYAEFCEVCPVPPDDRTDNDASGPRGYTP